MKESVNEEKEDLKNPIEESETPDFRQKIFEYKENQETESGFSFALENGTEEKTEVPKIKPPETGEAPDDEPEQDDTKGDDNEDKPKKEEKGRATHKASAKAAVMGMNAMTSRLCGAIGKKTHTSYTLTPAEKSEVLEITTEYFEAENITLSPFWVFISVISLTLGGKFSQAIEDRNADKHKKIREQKKVLEQRQLVARDAENVKDKIIRLGKETKSDSKEYPEFLEKYNERRRFSIHTKEDEFKGLYVFNSTDGKRFAMMKGEQNKDENSRPSKFVAEAYEMLKPSYPDKKELFKVLGSIMRQIQDFGKAEINEEFNKNYR